MFNIGDRAETERRFSKADLEDFGRLSGFAPENGQVPEPLLAGMISDLLGTTLPGEGTMYMKQKTDFKARGQADETVVASVEITRIREDKQLINLKTRCLNSRGDVLSEGEALVIHPGVGN
ncbi:phosphate acetyltransferase [Pseudomaricurvus alkylphenolicus]|jgi:hypothetical protein|uniref:phosphate acetyltransferase n=1 Tax=Pseudomaricurvus alkylphenolicus TaxID=1306991 RepID=UPI00141F0FD3|nr:phosphate acetyltransferase [Pseudomaricurvus alkylphenolicus]NIB41766.1 phosphate acetyltransferase [Pseudomaricurvus alkylphenolicus]